MFLNKAALHSNVIALTMKMGRERINTSPSPEAEYTVLTTYRDLGSSCDRCTSSQDIFKQGGQVSILKSGNGAIQHAGKGKEVGQR